MKASDIFRTPVISEQVLLLVSGKQELTRMDIYDIVAASKKQKHAAATAIWRLKLNKQITIENGIISFIGAVPKKKKADRIWEALRQSPSITVKELIVLTSASKSTIHNTLQRYQKVGKVKVAFYSWEQTSGGLRKVPHYVLIQKEIGRPR